MRRESNRTSVLPRPRPTRKTRNSTRDCRPLRPDPSRICCVAHWSTRPSTTPYCIFYGRLYAYHKYILGCHADAAKARPCTLTSNTFQQRRNIAIPLPSPLHRRSPRLILYCNATSVAVPSPFAPSVNPLPGKTIKCVESVVRTHRDRTVKSVAKLC